MSTELASTRTNVNSLSSELETTKNSVSSLSTSLSNHTHDDRYYTESEIDNKFAGVSSSSHTHDDRYYTESEIDNKFAGVSSSSHTHDDRYYTQSVIDSKLAGLSGGGSAGMVREFNSDSSGTFNTGKTEFTYDRNGAKIYTITVNINYNEYNDITDSIYYSFVIDYMSVQSSGTYRTYWLPSITVWGDTELKEFRGKSIMFYLESGGIRIKANNCTIVHVCGYE